MCNSYGSSRCRKPNSIWHYRETLLTTAFVMNTPRDENITSECLSLFTPLVLSHAKPEQEVSSVISPPNVSLAKITPDAKLLFVTSHIRLHLPVPAVKKRLRNGLSFSRFNKRITQISVNANATCYIHSTERAKLHTFYQQTQKKCTSMCFSEVPVHIWEV